MLDQLSYLLVDGDGPDDHLPGRFFVHVVEAQGVDLGSQVSPHLS